MLLWPVNFSLAFFMERKMRFHAKPPGKNSQGAKKITLECIDTSIKKLNARFTIIKTN